MGQSSYWRGHQLVMCEARVIRYALTYRIRADTLLREVYYYQELADANAAADRITAEWEPAIQAIR